jgi:adenylate cyclase
VTRLSDDGVIDAAAEAALLRGIAQTTERLVWWEFEALVDDVEHRLHLDNISARVDVLDRIAGLADILEEQMVYVWRRHLGAVIRWMGNRMVEAASGVVSQGGSLPLQRAVGFADLVGYTELTESLDARGLATLLHAFEATAEEIVVRGGGRVVKSLGDAVMFEAGKLADGAKIALDLAEAIGASGRTPPARVAMAWGGVLGRFGDVFGPPVNLAARLVAICGAGQVVVDELAAASLAGDPQLRTVPMSPSIAPGIGEILPFLLVRR